MSRSVHATCAVVLSFMACTIGLTGCQDPCVALAERICACERTVPERLTCRRNRVLNQQSAVQTSEEDRATCAAALDTCTCAALDTNDLAACAFTPTAPVGESPAGESTGAESTGAESTAGESTVDGGAAGDGAPG